MLIVLMAGSCAGKDTLQNIISKRFNIPICVSSTTRPMREGEIEGESYYFISKEKFLNDLKQGKFIEHRTYNTQLGVWYYGLSTDSVDLNKNQLVILDEQGYYTVVEKLGQINVLGIYISTPEREKIKRALDREPNRNDTKFFSELYRRMLDDLTAFDKAQRDENVYKVENIDLKRAEADIMFILQERGII